jgi:hypothetical protein
MRTQIRRNVWDQPHASQEAHWTFALDSAETIKETAEKSQKHREIVSLFVTFCRFLSSFGDVWRAVHARDWVLNSVMPPLWTVNPILTKILTNRI